ncbi:MAG TPA: bifunctional 4-hydroxy-2-oxoglutarate aldolase/2-dehydro-3-deoxy-phosphogluconate aldolase [Phycisphaerae bacterium]|nr:bifunctional 4-hydroxy-2-oxoglutarate aldolase/2-dehydro-3-deoxy-phosphogluconate aldolase [Phycisphaerae bacterium]HOJ56154.1 bifunctional 4-hydroxy-2-oxoglutarate aldolase/2-dehydro-3-deoxy-phosphogluconate aldolase [Phycisphaerae bacterium]HOL28099.1 bifunctional 4-hydroxy-2-oxoglutarate aldolase/2-dehydro-3-deoxy-phosphogluconate aldolase [Phycisphaerae bacterium]HPP19790.1 bifunctional 4-hydroxy-2-oxoglutarate aldolase/2-dehydro-3-deoxy-phosphogluconate aldolase [Phycisphaerae bacterium]
MASTTKIVSEIESTGVVAIIRAAGSSELVDVVTALRDGGLTCIEVTMTTPNALDVIHKARETLGDSAAIGVGTVLDAETARAAILAGAQFVVAPILDLPTIEMCRRYSVPVMPGAMTPTEIVRAWQAGADFVKVFPSTAAGPGLIRDLRGPLPQIKMIPTGGINLNNAAEFIKAGAAALGVGSALVTKEAVKNKDFAGLKAAAAQWLQCVRQAREATK